MKKILSLVLVLALCLSLFAGCGSDSSSDGYELAFVTDVGTIDDQSFNQSTYEGMLAWALDNDKTYKDYEPLSSSTTDLVDTMNVAIANGAKVIVAAGYVFPEAMTQVANENPDVYFILCDSDTEMPSNCCSFSYNVEYAGFLAGYATVMDGYTSLAYIGGISYPTVYNAGQGFMQGADAAAAELGITIDQIYGHTGNFDESAANKAMFTSIFSTGTEVLFSFGGSNTYSAYAAASEASPTRWIVTPDTDGTSQDATAYTSVMKELGYSVYSALDDIYNNNFAVYAGVNIVGIDEDMVGIPFENSKFTNFDADDYATAVALAKSTNVIVSSDANDAATAGDVDTFISELGLTNSNVTLWN
ncbi:MAG: BMP family ABC transporter substrate-binding protein [Bacillota bacterium]